jgi:RraA family protein
MEKREFSQCQKVNRPDKELVERFRNLPAANIADNTHRFACLHHSLKNYNKSRLLGTAFTVKTPSDDNLFVHMALDLALPGDVIVVETQGGHGSAIIGEIMTSYAIKRNLAGFIIDGLIRDVDAISQLNFPVYASGASPLGPHKDGPGKINIPISCGGVVINPGDILVGDEDGVVVISPREAEEVLEKTLLTMEEERIILQAIRDDTLDRDWIREKVKSIGP